MIDRVGADQFAIYVVAIAVRARHAFFASLLHNLNRVRRAMPGEIRSHLNAYNDVLVDLLIARIISMMKTTYVNICEDPGIFEFLPPRSAATTPPNEVLASAAGVAALFHILSGKLT